MIGFQGFSFIFVWQLPIDIVLPDVGSLTQAVLSFLHEMNNTSGKSGTVTPSALFGQVCKK